MLRPRWNKVLRDLAKYKSRTIIIVLCIAVGNCAFGTIAAARANVERGLRESYLAINPTSAVLTTDPFDDDLVEVVRRVEGVAAAEGQRTVAARIQTGRHDWYGLQLFVLPDDGERTVDIVRPEHGAWPPPKYELLLERSSLLKTRARVGDVVTIEVAGGEQRSLPITGLTHDLSLPPTLIAGKAFGYISFDTLEWLGGTRAYNQIQIVVAEHPHDEHHIRAVAARVADKIERSGREVYVTEVPTPQQHPAEQLIPTTLVIMSILGSTALLLGAFLIINTIEAILTQQVRQIGVMKAVGGVRRQIMELYAGMVLIVGILGLIISIPLGTLGAMGMARFMASQLNFEISRFEVPLWVLILEVIAALFLPVLAGLPAIHAAVRVSVREAIQGSGAGKQPTSHDALTRFIARIKGLPRPFLLALRNAFRHKGRLLRTLGVLTLGGAVFISVLTVRQSLYHSLDKSLASKQYDIEIHFARPYRAEKIVADIGHLPGVNRVEGWGLATAYPVRPDGSEGDSITLFAPPEDSTLLAMEMEHGRWLHPADDRAVVLSSNYLAKEPQARVGDEIVLKIDGEEYTWQIVGFTHEFKSPVTAALAYVNYDTFTQVVGRAGYIDSAQVITDRHDPAFHRHMTGMLEAYASQNNLRVLLVQSISEQRTLLGERFNVLTALLSTMAVLIAAVGGLGLMGMMSINVIERTREIGIMRAVGASDGMVQWIVIAEGLVVGLIAWGAATILSLPISLIMSAQIGMGLVDHPLDYTYATSAVGVWLVVVTVVAALASSLPAWNASRLTIREVLAYE